MKKLKSLNLDKLVQLFYSNYNTDCVAVDLIGVLEEASKSKLREYILHCFERDFTKRELQDITENIY